ncbi:uncharacterized protein N0V89_001484 [Didymosphaeria variabile]|uniref:Cytochrome P450 n=1 Tax=Didymosphaeria variabile TaxID=1932322 RepID=A0A9W8XYI7_9PLEO|nr:uncharacterized protein N0V89_001484 [Didymosphaeria variabile]KAJ4360915.1 hypothetical protein N0V89_001484 [Didymosphaeria variabile]
MASRPNRPPSTWSDKHGPIYSINIFGVNHIWLSSDRIANDLLSKRAAKHSDRPSINQLINSKTDPEYLPLLGYNAHHHRQRKIVTQFLSASARTNHQDIPYSYCTQFLDELRANPDDYENIMENYTGRVISRLAFGVPDHYLEIRQHSHGLLQAISPAAYITNIIPQLKLLPSWVSPWKWIEKARHARERVWFLQRHEEVKRKVAKGTAEDSFMRYVLDRQGKTDVSDLEAAYMVGMIGLAGVLTTSSCLMTYLLAMTLYPEWQTRVQVEIDEVCGERRPEMRDAPRMPVLRAVIMELLRWRPITPSSIPHETTEDDVYDGYFIPKGTYIHPNQWAITRDAEVYPDPEVFEPARWLDPAYPSYREPLTEYPCIRNFTTFGYGRRLCMGMDLVENEFFVSIGAMAWAFDVARKVGDDGREVEIPRHDYTTYLISRPRKFAFDLKARQ